MPTPPLSSDSPLLTRASIVEMYTDGACAGNPGPGGWGVLLRYLNSEKELFGGERHTTNNRMELMAVIAGLNSLSRPCRLNIFTDSQYVKNGITIWIHNWKKRAWRTAANGPVKNTDLWQQLELSVQTHEIEWYWIKGHSGHIFNERADELARRGIKTVLPN